jgi:hypothetical protein
MKLHPRLLPELRYIVVPQIRSSSTRQGPVTEHESHMLERDFFCLGDRPACSAIRRYWALAEAGRPDQGAALITSLLESSKAQGRFTALELFLMHRLISCHSNRGRVTDAELSGSMPVDSDSDPSSNSYMIGLLRSDVTKNGANYAVLNNLACSSHVAGSKIRAWRTFCWAYKMSLFDRLVGLNLATASFEVNRSDLGDTLLKAHQWRFR